MISLPQLPLPRFVPSKDTLKVLNGRVWICSYSGGKDSTSLVTYIEWLRRLGWVTCPTPRLVMSDTTVEFPFLRGIADRLMAALARTGWECEVVTPKISGRLYNRIFGIGNTPVHPGGRTRMRWCTRATKLDPMKRFGKTIAPDVLHLSGVRWGESDVRDGKLKAGGCKAGGECGLPDPGEGVYGPIIAWRTCQVVEWLSGQAGVAVSQTIPDLLPMMRDLIDVYEVKIGDAGMMPTVPPPVTALRFGCIGCPAISNEKVTKSKAARSHPEWVHLKRIYGVWDALYNTKNRCCRVRTGPDKHHAKKPKKWSNDVGYGPIRMAARKQYLPVILDIQEKAGVHLIGPDDLEFIHDCWDRKVYPRGWSAADELVVPPSTFMTG